jgi:hypothetical protein
VDFISLPSAIDEESRKVKGHDTVWGYVIRRVQPNDLSILDQSHQFPTPSTAESPMIATMDIRSTTDRDGDLKSASSLVGY